VCLPAFVWVCSQLIVLLRAWLARAARRGWDGILCHPAVCQEWVPSHNSRQATCGGVLLLCPVCIEALRGWNNAWGAGPADFSVARTILRDST
jgi:hypothetical protein